MTTVREYFNWRENGGGQDCDQDMAGIAACFANHCVNQYSEQLFARIAELESAQTWQPISDLDRSMCCEWLLSDDECNVFTGHWSDYFGCWVIYDGQQDHPMYRFEPTKFKKVGAA